MNLLDAVNDNNLEEVNRLLLNPDVNLNIVDEYGNGPLMVALVQYNNSQLNRRLVAAGVDINTANDNGMTALMIAARNYKPDIVKLLLEQPNIDINARDKQGRTALYWTTYDVSVDIAEMLLAAGSGLQASRQTDPNIVDNDGVTLFSNIMPKWNSAARKIKMFDLLVKYGADINIRDNQGLTPLMDAVRHAYVPIVKYLLTVPGIDVDLADTGGTTALMLAAKRSDAELIELLLKAGADPLIKNHLGHTAYNYSTLGTTMALLYSSKKHWTQLVTTANKRIREIYMIINRLKQNQTFPQKQIAQRIFAIAEYDQSQMFNNLNKPRVVALARSLNIKTTDKTKIQLSSLIVERLA